MKCNKMKSVHITSKSVILLMKWGVWIMKNKLKHFLLLTASTLIMAVGVYFFKFANNFTFGGITGLAVLIAKTESCPPEISHLSPICCF